jgi:hypothetical protein
MFWKSTKMASIVEMIPKLHYILYSTSKVCIKFGLIVSFIRTATAPVTPYKQDGTVILF